MVEAAFFLDEPNRNIDETTVLAGNPDRAFLKYNCAV